MIRECIICFARFNTPPRMVKKGRGKYCSVGCMSKGFTTLPKKSTCKVCSKAINREPSKKVRAFCSNEHYQYYRKTVFISRRIKNECKRCHYLVYSPPSIVRKYCSNICAGLSSV